MRSETSSADRPASLPDGAASTRWTRHRRREAGQPYPAGQCEQVRRCSHLTQVATLATDVAQPPQEGLHARGQRVAWRPGRVKPGPLDGESHFMDGAPHGRSPDPLFDRVARGGVSPFRAPPRSRYPATEAGYVPRKREGGRMPLPDFPPPPILEPTSPRTAPRHPLVRVGRPQGRFAAYSRRMPPAP
jgi:hypothetical protein